VRIIKSVRKAFARAALLKKSGSFLRRIWRKVSYEVSQRLFWAFGDKYKGKTTLVSFYTCDWRYPEYAENLRRECLRLHMPHRIEELQSTGSYLKNTCLKPTFIRDKLREIKGPVLWVDCDGSLLRPPVFFDGLTCDFAAKKMPKGRARTWHVGTMWFNYNDTVLHFLDRWIENSGEISDESALERTWRQIQLDAVDIPSDYFVILRANRMPHGVICHRISDGEVKLRELPLAIEKAKKGIL